MLQSEAQELTIVKMCKFGGGIGAPSKEERLKEAADIHLRLGQIQRYCELMVELGQVSVCLKQRAVSSLSYPGISIFTCKQYKEKYYCIVCFQKGCFYLVLFLLGNIIFTL